MFDKTDVKDDFQSWRGIAVMNFTFDHEFSAPALSFRTQLSANLAKL